MEPLRVGILGTANIAGRALLKPAADVPAIAVLAVGSRTLERAREFATANDIPRACTYEGLLSDPDIDVVYVALPPSMHAEWSINALNAGKHVLCEKPMASNAAEALLVLRAIERTQRIYMEAFHYPYHPFAKRVRDLLDTGAVGPIESVKATFQIPSKFVGPGNNRRKFMLGGGALMDCGCYAVHALRNFLGIAERVVSARAIVDPAEPQVDISMEATLEFAGGRQGSLHASFLAAEKPDVELEVIGTRGRLDITSLYVPQWGGELRLRWRDRLYVEQADATPSYVFQLRELVRCVRNGAPVLTSAEDGLVNMQVIDEIYRKAGLDVRGAAVE